MSKAINFLNLTLNSLRCNSRKISCLITSDIQYHKNDNADQVLFPIRSYLRYPIQRLIYRNIRYFFLQWNYDSQLTNQVTMPIKKRNPVHSIAPDFGNLNLRWNLMIFKKTLSIFCRSRLHASWHLLSLNWPTTLWALIV